MSVRARVFVCVCLRETESACAGSAPRRFACILRVPGCLQLYGGGGLVEGSGLRKTSEHTHTHTQCTSTARYFIFSF